MSTTVRLGPFSGLFSALGGAAPEGFAGSLLNVRVGDGWIRPRYGYRNLAAKPAGLTGVYGLARLQGYDDEYLPQLEWVSIEKRAGVVKPYAIDPSTWARTEITNGGAPLSLNDGDWLGFAFDASSYWINPGNAPSLYRHRVGDPASWISLQSATYIPIPDDPSFDVEVQGENRRALDPATDAITGVNVDFLNDATFALASDGNLEVSGKIGDADHVGSFTLTCVFAAPIDLSYDYCALGAIGGLIDRTFRAGTYVEIRTGGVWSKPPQHEGLSPDRDRATVTFRMKGLAGATAVEAIRIRLYADPWANQTGLGFKLSPLWMGGTYIGADNSFDRPWDATYRQGEETYGVRYHNIAASTFTGFKAVVKGPSFWGSVVLGPSGPIGDNVLLTATPNLQAPYVDDPAGASYEIQWLRKDLNGNWKVLGTSPNTAGQSFRDRLEANEVTGLTPTITPGTFVPPDPAPVFSVDGFVGGVPFKGWVVWFRRGGKSNVQHSKVGDAESTFDPQVTGDVEDNTRPATFTLADDFADEPLGGVQAGGALLIAGRQGIYGQSGDYPSQMTPPRKAPGSMGCAGRFAFARFRGDGGEYGIAWLDSSGENVWFASTSLVYSTDTQARPVEFSAPIRGTLRKFLYDDQKDALPDLTLSQARMDVDESTGSLWIFLGQRAAILRPPSMIDGKRQWELSRFALGMGGGVPILVCADPYGATTYADVARSPSTLAWSNPSNAAPGVPVASSAGFVPGLSSHWLQGTAMMPWTAHPAEATITSVKLRVRHRLTSTSSPPTPVMLSAVQSGALSLTPNLAVPDEFTDVEIDLAALALTAATLNAGLDVRIAYDAAAAGSGSFHGGGPFGGEGDGDWDVQLAYDGTSTVQNAGGTTTYEWPDQMFCQTSTPNTSVLSSGTTYLTPVWVGAGPSPVFVALSIHAEADGLGKGAGGLEPVADCANGLGDPTYVGGFGPGFIDKHSAGTHIVGVMAGQPHPVTSFGSGTAGGTADGYNPPGATGRVDVSGHVAEASSLLPSTVEVESMTIEVCYTVPSADGERTVAYTAFGQRHEGLVWIRSSGHIDAAEWCPTCEHYVEGTSRDGGLPMPAGHWECARDDGPARRLTRVELERSGFGAIDVQAFTDRLLGGESSSAPADQRWMRFSPLMQGTQHRVRLQVPETLAGVSSIDLVYLGASGPGR